MNVLSLFDGISCGQLALQRAGIKVDNYYASEIDKYAMKITKQRFPKTIFLGDVRLLKKEMLPRIDLLIGGSPCQGFSNCGAGENFNDPRSKLFFDFLRLKREVSPKFFLLENVKMKKEWLEIINNFMGVNPLFINSSVMSAQNRQRYYWSNIYMKRPPADKSIFLTDIIDSGVVDKEKSYCITACEARGTNPQYYFSKRKRQLIFEQKEGRFLITEDHLEKVKNIWSLLGNDPETLQQEKLGEKIKIEGISYRKLTPQECEKLQTLPLGYTEGISNCQRYKTIGNAWTVDVLAHIFSFLKEDQ